jgi:general stress protein YciG
MDRNGSPESFGQITVKQAGQRGGRATLENQGVDFFRKIGRKGGQRTAELYSKLLKEFGKKGGRPRRPALTEPVGEGDHD